jgi:hypothetical protein
MMTRVDYVRLADILRRAKHRVQDNPLTASASDTLYFIGVSLCDYMATDNKNFNAQIFMREAGL